MNVTAEHYTLFFRTQKVELVSTVLLANNSNTNNFSGLICRLLFLILVFYLAYYFIQGSSIVRNVPILQPLRKFPPILGEWRIDSSRKSTDAEISMLGVDDYVEFNYSTSASLSLNFYAAFYESVGTGGGYHSPRNCLPGSGWGVVSSKPILIAPKGKEGGVKVSEMLIRNGNSYQLVLYWYQNRGRIIHSEYLEKIYLVFDAIKDKRRDGTFVRLITPVRDGDILKSEKLLINFAELAMTELENYLPGR